jgi:glycosyltransferase involved in cell wall biosynthesis
MKVLLVLAEPPLPEGGAPGRCSLALIRGLLEQGVDVFALAARQHYAPGGTPPDDVPVEVISVAPEQPGWTARLRKIRRPRGHLGRGAFAERVRELAAYADVVHLDETKTSWCDRGVTNPSLVHIHYLIRRDRAWGKPWERHFRVMLEEVLAEQAAVRRHRFLVASSPVVARELRARAPHSEVVLAPLSVDGRYYAPAPLHGPPTVGIIGTAAWGPTAAAMRRLVRRVWPEVHRRVPAARLIVAGRGTTALAGLPAGPGVEVRGEVPSSPRFLSELSLLLYPLERGSGMKVKVLEAIATGLPVVATPSGAEGIEADDGIVIESSDQSLALAAARLLTDDEERARRGAAARRAFERLYLPVPASAPLVELYARIAEGR